QVTKDVLKEFLDRYGKVVDMEKENKRIGMVHHESAIAIVKDYDLPVTPQQYSQSLLPMYLQNRSQRKRCWPHAKSLPGVNRLLQHLHKHGIPFALASNSIRKNVGVKLSSQKVMQLGLLISRLFLPVRISDNTDFSYLLRNKRLGRGHFRPPQIILGSDEVKSGKPAPDLWTGSECGNHINSVGIKAGKAANMQVVAVPSVQSESDEFSIADYVIHSFLDFQPETWGLPPLNDWVMKALPIEPIQFKGSYRNGYLQENSDNGASDLPGQVWGVYFGWVEGHSQERLKIVVSIRWDHSCGSFRRNIQACFINGTDGPLGDETMEIALIGYIRGFCTKSRTGRQQHIAQVHSTESHKYGDEREHKQTAAHSDRQQQIQSDNSRFTQQQQIQQIQTDIGFKQAAHSDTQTGHNKPDNTPCRTRQNQMEQDRCRARHM
ncbi:bifunctional riboflavin kinase/FMN phosphatase-like protein, partial [Tanacetum coccineum]